MNKKRGISIEQAAEIRAQRGADRPCKLRALRAAKGYSQADLARESGVVLKTIQRFERIPTDIDKTRLETFFALCRALDCKISDIIEDEEVLREYKKYR